MSAKNVFQVAPVVKALRITLITLLILYGLVFVGSLFFVVSVFPSFIHSGPPHAVFWAEIRVLINKVLTGPIYAVVAYSIFRLVTLISRKDPFNLKSPAHIRRIGYSVFALGALHAIVNAISEWTSPGVRVPEALVRVLYDGLGLLLLGFGFLVIAKVIEVGVALKQDQDLTV